MFAKSKGQKPRKRQTDGDNSKPKPSLSQLGFLDIPNVSDLALGNIGEDDDNDSDLEAELLALTSGKDSNGPKRAKKVVKSENLDKLVAECMKDNDDDDEDLDEEDPDLLAELSALGPEEGEDLPNEEAASEASLASPDLPSEKPVPVIVRPSPFMAGTSVVNLLKERIEMYKEAEQNALEMGETSRVKRFNRGLKTLNQMLKDVNNGKSINEEDIPPAVLRHSSRNNSSSDLANLPQSKSEPKPLNQNQNQNQNETVPTPTTTIPQNIAFSENLPCNEEPSSSPLSILFKRQLEYKKAALAAKKIGSTEEALRLMKIVKQFEPLIQAAKEGQNIDIDSLPPPPNTEVGNTQKCEVNSTSKSIEENETQKNDSEAVQPQPQPQPQPQTAVPTPTSVVEALEQRLAKYTEQRDKAKAEGNARKQRMNDRIIKQYQDAIRTHKMGRHVDFSELPTPPGFPPIPIGGSSQGPASTTSPTSSNSTALPQYSKTNSEEPQVKPVSRPSPDPPAGPVAPKSVPPSVPKGQAPAAPPRAKMNVRKNPQSMVERQLSVLKRRHDQFKVAALEAKKKGEIEQAKEYVRNFKGIEQLIGATEGGLPVDMNTVPIPPQEKLGCENVSIDFEVIDKEDCVFGPPTSDADAALTYSKLEEDLIAQIKMCAHTREHFKALGDVASANRFEQLILHTKKDLDAVRAAFKRGDTPPRFHYENRTFTLIQCNTDINDSDCEVCIIRGINFNVPNPTDVDTYVKIEFPYPSDAPPQERTNVVKDTNNPEFNHKVVFSIDRKARALSRVFKRHSIKCQIITKGGWFHRDNVLGNVKIPLVSLETKCTLHDSFDLIDDKKKMIGGKLEVKVRVRNPILSKQLEKVTEKWIIIDGF